MPKWIVGNFGIKILSIFTALLLWFHVTTEKRYEKTIEIPISCVNLPENLLLTKSPPKLVKIKIRGNGKELLRFGRSIKVVLDLKETDLGWKRIDLKKEDVSVHYESKMEIASDPIPKSFIMRVEREVRREVKVVPNLKSEYKSEIIPEMVEISGGSSVYQISEIITEEIIVSPEFPETLKVKLEIPEGIKISTDSVVVVLQSL